MSIFKPWNSSELTLELEDTDNTHQTEGETREIPGLDRLRDIKPWQASFIALNLKQLAPKLYSTRQRTQIQVNADPVVDGLPVVYYPDTEYISIELRRLAAVQKPPQYTTQRFCCSSWPAQHSELKTLMVAFLSDVADFKVYGGCLCEAIVTKRLEIYAFLEAVSLFRSRLANQVWLVKMLHECAVERNSKDYGYLQNRTFLKDCTRARMNVTIVENTKVGFQQLLQKVTAEMHHIDQFAQRVHLLGAHSAELRTLFEKLEQLDTSSHVMAKHIGPLREEFQTALDEVFDTEMWRVFRQFLLAWEQTQNEARDAAKILHLAMELIVWAKLAMIQIDRLLTSYSGRFSDGIIPEVAEVEKVR